MTTWNYRLVRHQAGTENECVGLYEIYYDDVGFARRYGSRPCGFLSDNVEHLRKLLETVKDAFDKPVIDEKDLPGYVKP